MILQKQVDVIHKKVGQSLTLKAEGSRLKERKVIG